MANIGQHISVFRLWWLEKKRDKGQESKVNCIDSTTTTATTKSFVFKNGEKNWTQDSKIKETVFGMLK